MPLQRKSNEKECVSYNIREMIRKGHPKNQAVVASIQFCKKAHGSSNDGKLELSAFKTLVEMELEKVRAEKKFIQKAIKKPGSFTSWCKKQGFDGVTDECIRKALKSPNKKVQARAKLAIALRNIAKKK